MDFFTEQLYIDHARDIANGCAPIAPDVLKRAIEQNRLEGPFQEQHAEQFVRNTFRVLIESLAGSGITAQTREGIFDVFKSAYQHDRQRRLITDPAIDSNSK